MKRAMGSRHHELQCRHPAGTLQLCSTALAVPWVQAVWSIAFALSSRQKVAVLVYWVAALAVGLPAMVRLAASGRVSNIIGGWREAPGPAMCCVLRSTCRS